MADLTVGDFFTAADGGLCGEPIVPMPGYWMREVHRSCEGSRPANGTLQLADASCRGRQLSGQVLNDGQGCELSFEDREPGATDTGRLTGDVHAQRCAALHVVYDSDQGFIDVLPGSAPRGDHQLQGGAEAPSERDEIYLDATLRSVDDPARSVEIRKGCRLDLRFAVDGDHRGAGAVRDAESEHLSGVGETLETLGRDLYGSAKVLRPGGQRRRLADPHHFHPGGGQRGGDRKQESTCSAPPLACRRASGGL